MQDPESGSGKLPHAGHSWGRDLLSWLSEVGKKRVLARPAGSRLDINPRAYSKPFPWFSHVGLCFPL